MTGHVKPGWQQVEDWLTDIIAENEDMNWEPRDPARAIVHRLKTGDCEPLRAALSAAKGER